MTTSNSLNNLVLMYSTLASTEGKLYTSSPDVYSLIDFRYNAGQSTGSSGLSFGTFELDVANNSAAYSLFDSLLNEAYQAGRISQYNRFDYLDRAATKGIGGTADAFSFQELGIINTQVLQPGSERIFQADLDRLLTVSDPVQRTIDAIGTKWGGQFANPNMSDLNYRLLVGQMTSWKNRIGDPDIETMRAYLTGQNVGQGLGVITAPQSWSDLLDGAKNYLLKQKAFSDLSDPETALNNIESNIRRGLNLNGSLSNLLDSGYVAQAGSIFGVLDDDRTGLINSLNKIGPFKSSWSLTDTSDLSRSFRALGYSADVIGQFESPLGFSALGSANSYLDLSTYSYGFSRYTLFNTTSYITLPSIAAYATNSPWYDDGFQCVINPLFTGFSATLSGVKNRRSPLVLDLDGDGIESTAMDNGVFFDIDNDNYAEKVGWVSADDGLLAMDVNNDGQINNITELYGDDIMPAFQKLALHDSNKNGKIDQGDADYSKLLVWRDLNQDGHTDAGETQTLEQAGVKEISLAERNVDTYQNENYFSTKATYTKFDNTTHDITDVHFLNDNVNTWFMGAQSQVYGSTYQVKAEALLLPLSRGYGSLADMMECPQ